MRALMPHLRLLTLRPDETIDILQSFLTPDELLHVLHFQICGTLKTNIPDTLNINTVERTPSKLTEYCVTLIPDEAVSKDFEHLKEADVYFWDRSEFSEQINSVTLTPKTDVYLTGFEYLCSFPSERNSNLKLNMKTRSYEIQPSICLPPTDFFQTIVSISPPYYDVPSEIDYLKTKFGYQNVWESANFVPKGQTVTLTITLSSIDEASYSRRLRLIKDETVNEFIQTNDSCKDFGEIVVKQCDITHEKTGASSKSPYFIKTIRYIKSC
jgi:hypothetical protein